MLALTLPPALLEPPPAESLGVLLERARKARDHGNYPGAIQAYDAMLSQVPTHETALLERAETLGWAQQFVAAREGYLAFRKAFPARALTADLALARLAAWQDHSAEALAILDPWIKQEQRQAVLDAAKYLSWGGRLPESLVQTRRWLVTHPEDLEAMLLEARVLSWAGLNAQARGSFYRVLTLDKTNREALIGLARLALWEGNTKAARQMVGVMPPEVLAHPEAQVVLAQVEVAEGKTRSALSRARTQAESGPAQRDATELRDDLVRAFGPWVEITANRTDTSEGLRTETPSLRARVPLGDGALTLASSIHRVKFNGDEHQPSETSIGVAYPMGWGLNATGIFNRVSDVGGVSASGYVLGLGYTLSPGLDLTVNRERSYALFTPQALAFRTVFVSTDLGATWRFGQGRHAVNGSVGQTDVTASGGISVLTSTRRSHALSYEFRFPVTLFDLRGGLLTRSFGYSQTLPLGFFNPESYRWDGAFTTATWRRGRIFEVMVGAQTGSQTVNGGHSQFTWAYRTGLTWCPPSCPLDYSIWWTQSQAGLPVTTPLDPSAYREHTLGFSLKLRGTHWIW